MADENATTNASNTVGDATNKLALLLAITQLRSDDPLVKAQAARSLAQAGLSTEAIQNFLGTAATKGLGAALPLLGLGLDLTQIAKADTSTTNKVKAGTLAGGKAAVATAFPPAIPFLIAQGLGDLAARELQKSGSPQVRGLGRTVGRAFTPIDDPFFDVRNPVPQLEQVGKQLLIGGPIGAAITEGIGFDPFREIFGMGKPPTFGVRFRGGAGQLFNKLGLKPGQDIFLDKGIRKRGAAFEAGLLPESKRAFDINPEFLASLPQEAVDAARAFGELVTQTAPATNKRKDQEAFAIQLQNILLNSLGADTAAKVPELLEQLGIKPPK